MEAKVSYIEAPEPIKAGDGAYAFGAYQVEVDGMVFLAPHTGMPGTVSASPMPIDDPGVRGGLIAIAKRAFSQAD